MALLSVEEFRSLSQATILLSDEALQTLLDGAEAAIDAVCGPSGTITETRDGGGTYLLLARRASTVTTVTERWSDQVLELDPDDFELRNGNALRRVTAGPNPSSWWVGSVLVEYESADDDALRRLAQAELVKLEIISNPGLAMQVVGNWTVQFVQGRSYAELRADILGSLPPAGLLFA